MKMIQLLSMSLAAVLLYAWKVQAQIWGLSGLKIVWES